jgi:tetratricopeptide (TPR) repeat protein
MRRPYELLLLVAAAAPLLGAIEPAVAPPTPPAGPICHAESKDDPAPPAKALLTGYGTGGFVIRTTSAEAQAYFDNGMQLAHAFAHKAATSAFKRTEQLDPTCAMCVWGEAWSRGPTINYPIDKKKQVEAAALADRAAVLGAGGPPRERALIAALQKRYRDGGGGGAGDYAFARAMDDLARAWPGDNEIAVIAADAWMIPAADHRNRAHLDRAIEILQAVLQRAPDDTGAIHFYIHATEMDGVGVRALPYAEKLQALAPAASHLVHMPSHTYFWAGRYRAAELSNLDAVEIDKRNAARLKPKDGVFGLVYHGHNVQYGEGAALMDGDAKGALSLAATEIGQLPTIKPDKGYAQMGLGTAYFVYGRYGSPGEVAALADPGSRLPYAQAMWRYAKGEAAARRGDAPGVRAEAAAIAVAPADLKTLGELAPRARAMVEVARLVLTGRAAMLEGRFAEAEAAYRNAAEIQETRLGELRDPPAWWYPVRRSLAAALEAQGKPAAAAAEARKAMVRWPFDPVSLDILADSERRVGQADDARRQLAYARANWTGDVSGMPLALR